VVDPLPTWDLLICTIPHRHGGLCGLLEDLDRQITENNAVGRVGAVLYRDNITVTYGAKTQALLNAATADYVSCIDDDDLLAPGAMTRVLHALDQRPDYVGFAVRWTKNGDLMLPVEHSLRHPPWENKPDMLYRSVMHFNPIRRDIALGGTWDGGNEAEVRWQSQILTQDRCKTEVWIPDPPVYWYRENTFDTFNSTRAQIPAYQIEPVPSYPWLRVLETEHSV
jgi:hypothetical protein